MALGLYIHVPFCRSRCHFCAFYLQVYREDRVRQYIEGVHREIAYHASHGTIGTRLVDTVYFGGGTPTALETTELISLMTMLRRAFNIAAGAEITVEASPDTVTRDSLAQLADAGVTRLSLGVQSMDAQALIEMGRSAMPDTINTAVTHARRAGLHDVNLDLIYGFPDQTVPGWRRTLDDVLALEPTHVACYALTVEERTRLAVDVHRGVSSEPDPEVQNAMEELAEDQLREAGYVHYEVSNFCRPGRACRHNLLYWQDGEYLGLGPSAQSFVDSFRFGNVADLQAYGEALLANRLPLEGREQLDEAQRRREALIFGLRLTEGTPFPASQIDDGDREQQAVLSRLVNAGLLERAGPHIRLTARGRRFADSVSVELS